MGNTSFPKPPPKAVSSPKTRSSISSDAPSTSPSSRCSTKGSRVIPLGADSEQMAHSHGLVFLQSSPFRQLWTLIMVICNI